MFKKRNLLIFLLNFILSITVVSANELANDTAINCKNQAVLSEINIDESVKRNIYWEMKATQLLLLMLWMKILLLHRF